MRTPLAFTQPLDPIGDSLVLSAVLAALPLLLLFVLLGVFRMKAYQAEIGRASCRERVF